MKTKSFDIVSEGEVLFFPTGAKCHVFNTNAQIFVETQNVSLLCSVNLN